MVPEILLQEIRSNYFTDTDEVNDGVIIDLKDIIEYESKLQKIELENGFNAINDAIESFIEELKKRVT